MSGKFWFVVGVCVGVWAHEIIVLGFEFLRHEVVEFIRG